jgi:hypothetical protein
MKYYEQKHTEETPKQITEYEAKRVLGVHFGDTKINDIVTLLKEGHRFFTNDAVYYAEKE